MPQTHLTFPSLDTQHTITFYERMLGCKIIDRKENGEVEFSLFDYVFHASPCEQKPRQASNLIDNVEIPVRHMEVALAWDDWHTLTDRLKERYTHFVIEPRVRIRDGGGEVANMFLIDPNGNAIEISAVK